ncbi:MAG: sigma-70 family RNA polymerase sigma factor [Planctomycetota bacterium]|jgi:RNA polymerase sigma factor (TIGR02999 family)
MAEEPDITRVLDDLRGDPAAVEALFPLVYAELRAVAGSFFRGQRANHTLQPTALVHDAYVKLAGSRDPRWAGRAHFIAVAARAMRQILINHARDRRAEKRGGDGARVTLVEEAVGGPAREADLVELDDALSRLEQLDARQCRIVELRYFGGLSVEETAMVLDVSAPTVKRDWRMARSWLFRELSGGDDA